MKTPAGKECKFFYGDYYRGKNHEECRLLKDNNLTWDSRMCTDCPVPEIVISNSCENLKFIPSIKRPLGFMKPKLKVDTYCTKTTRNVEEPRVGCGECHPGLQNLIVFPDETNPTD